MKKLIMATFLVTGMGGFGCEMETELETAEEIEALGGGVSSVTCNYPDGSSTTSEVTQYESAVYLSKKCTKSGGTPRLQRADD